MKFGVDIGGTTVKIGVVEGTKIIDKFIVVTKKETLFADFDSLSALPASYTSMSDSIRHSIGSAPKAK